MDRGLVIPAGVSHRHYHRWSNLTLVLKGRTSSSGNNTRTLRSRIVAYRTVASSASEQTTPSAAMRITVCVPKMTVAVAKVGNVRGSRTEKKTATTIGHLSIGALTS